MTIQGFQKIVLHFYRKHARKDLPWRRTRDPWAILVSEVMLQQTQVSRVEEKFREFMKIFPSVQLFARAQVRTVLQVWHGLGYNRRALNLQRTARMIVKKFQGVVPGNPEDLDSLPGIGHYTANAVCAFTFNKPLVFLDTNIRRVFLHHFFRRHRESVSDEDIFPLIEQTLYRKNPRLWYSALMDYGAMGDFGENPNRKSKQYAKQSRFEGSKRFARAKIIAFLLGSRKLESIGAIRMCLCGYSRLQTYRRLEEVKGMLQELQKEGFLENRGQLWRVKR